MKYMVREVYFLMLIEAYILHINNAKTVKLDYCQINFTTLRYYNFCI